MRHAEKCGCQMGCWHCPPPEPETLAEETARLQREIGERQLRLQRLVLGDPTQGVSGQALPTIGIG